MKAKKTIGVDISPEAFDRKFDAGGSIIDYLDLDSARRPGLEPKRVNVDFPAWVVHGLDRQAQRLGVTRQALIKLWIAERLEKLMAKDEAAA